MARSDYKTKKTISSQKNSLGPVYDLLTRAMQSKRCHVYLNSDEILHKNFDNPPCEAAMASDLAIHNCLVAGTAGIEVCSDKYRYSLFRLLWF